MMQAQLMTTQANTGKRNREEEDNFEINEADQIAAFPPPLAPTPTTTPPYSANMESLSIELSQMNMRGRPQLGDLYRLRERYSAELITAGKQSETYLACKKHIEIIEVAIQRNYELIDLYTRSCREMESEPRVKSTLDLYLKLREELVVANEKMKTLQQSLASKSSMNPEAYKSLRTRLEGELEQVSRLIDNQLPGE
jgi:hypothetical protein